MKICFFQIFKSSFSQPFLTMASSFSTPNNQYCFIIGLRSNLSWFGRNPLHNIIVVLRSKQILFLSLTTTFVHKVTHNKAGIVVPCFLGLVCPGNLSPTETPFPKLSSRSLSPIAWSSSKSSGSKQTATWLVSKTKITS